MCTSFYACSKYQPGVCSPFIHYVISGESVGGERQPKTDCANAQAGLGFRCPHLSEEMSSHDAAHIALCIPLDMIKAH